MLIELLSKKCYCIVKYNCNILYSFTWKIIWNFSFLLKCHFLLCVGSAEYTPNYATTSWKRQAPRTGKEMQQKPTKGERAASFFQFPAAITPRVAAVRCPSCTPFSTRPTPQPQNFPGHWRFSRTKAASSFSFFSGRGCCLRSRFSLDLSHSPNGKINLSPCTVLHSQCLWAAENRYVRFLFAPTVRQSGICPLGW